LRTNDGDNQRDTCASIRLISTSEIAVISSWDETAQVSTGGGVKTVDLVALPATVVMAKAGKRTSGAGTAAARAD